MHFICMKNNIYLIKSWNGIGAKTVKIGTEENEF